MANKVTKKLSPHVATRVSSAVETLGTTDVSKVIGLVGGGFTGKQVKDVTAFLTWVNTNGKSFSAGIETLWAKFTAAN